MTKKKMLLGVAVILLVIAGCQLTSDMLWPAAGNNRANSSVLMGVEILLTYFERVRL